MSLPIAWVLENKPVLVVGGGEVAETRVRKLVPNDAAVTVIAPEATPYIRELAEANKLCWLERAYEHGDLEREHWTFVLTALDDHDVSREIAERCRAKRIPVNVADVIPLCDFYFGANFEQGPLKVLVSTGSGAPRLARRVLDELSAFASKFRFAEAISNVRELRKVLRSQIPGTDPKTSQIRMALMRTLCDKLSFNELAELKESEMAPMVRGMVLSTAACPVKLLPEPNGANAESSERNGSKVRNSKPKKSSESKPHESKPHELKPHKPKPKKSNDCMSNDSMSNDTLPNDAMSEDSDSDSDSDSASSTSNDSSSSSSSSSSQDFVSGMKRSATECAEGYPQPDVPPFPFRVPPKKRSHDKRS